MTDGDKINQHIGDDCRRCKTGQLVALTNEVDIGVGMLSHVLGYECPNCGIFVVCPDCGIALDSRPHWDWCANMKELRLEDIR
ncbi:hypothetical protein LCGC14_1177400 [marine sediment metagenome]|uniref:Uncharacterized protein n=1 Tax=marine sediment metagenome TaxID=412755 RepID=A0A0F9P630_9ZZZZ